mgnify:CR=1 FL=1
MGNRVGFAAGEWYHCYNRGVDKRRTFNLAADYERFLALLYVCNGDRSVQLSDYSKNDLKTVLSNEKINRGEPLVEIATYCLMPNHIHLVLRQVQERGIPLFMQKVFTAYTMYFNRRHNRTGPLFAGIALLFTPGSVVQKKYIEASTAARILVWQGAFSAIQERPLLGWGPDNFERAFQGHFDNRLYETENIGEIWFDRAHNIIVDTLVDVGFVGALASGALVGAFVLVVYRARKKGLLQDTEAVLLVALPVAHFLQLQTAFDTVSSYTLLGVLVGYGLWLERSIGAESSHRARTEPENLMHKTLAGVLVVFVLMSAKYFMFDEFVRQNALFQLFVETNAQKQVPLAQTATSRLSSFESTRLLSTTFLTNVLRQVSKEKLNKPSLNLILSITHVYEDKFERYLAVQPEHYRAHINLAYLQSIETVLGENKLTKAKEVVAEAYPLSPNHPLTYAMDALMELYSGNIKLAKEKARAGIALNPNITFSQSVLEHIEKQEKTFPTISVMRLEKL